MGLLVSGIYSVNDVYNGGRVSLTAVASLLVDILMVMHGKNIFSFMFKERKTNH